MFLGIDAAGWTVIATLVGPIAAVQAQKWIERYQERQRQRQWIFYTLMATRQHGKLQANHVEALNAIDIVYYGRRIRGQTLRTKAEQSVLDAWHTYLQALGDKASDDKGEPVLLATRNELYTNLL